jgi:hypothetical protein
MGSRDAAIHPARHVDRREVSDHARRSGKACRAERGQSPTRRGGNALDSGGLSSRRVLGTYFGRKADAERRERLKAEAALGLAEEDKRKAEEAQQKAEEAQRKAQEDQRKAEEALRKTEAPLREVEEELRLAFASRLMSEENLRAMVARRRQKGHSDTEIADDLGCTVQELVQRYPPQS